MPDGAEVGGFAPVELVKTLGVALGGAVSFFQKDFSQFTWDLPGEYANPLDYSTAEDAYFATGATWHMHRGAAVLKASRSDLIDPESTKTFVSLDSAAGLRHSRAPTGGAVVKLGLFAT